MAKEYSSLWEAMQTARVAAAPAYAEAVDAADKEYQAAISQPDCDYAAAWSCCYMARKDAAVAYDNAIRQAILTYRSRETHERTISDGLATGGLKPPSPTGTGSLRRGELPCLQSLCFHYRIGAVLGLPGLWRQSGQCPSCRASRSSPASLGAPTGKGFSVSSLAP